jgi:hypothetical protein
MKPSQDEEGRRMPARRWRTEEVGVNKWDVSRRSIVANTFSEGTKDLAVDLVAVLLFGLVIGLAIYLLAVFLAMLGVPWLRGFKVALDLNGASTIGLPCAAVGSFGVVALLLHAFPPEKQAGAIKIKFFGAEFTGPAGPITLWLACFLSFVVAIKVLHGAA